MPDFSNVDLGTDKTMRRIVRNEAIKQNEIIERCAQAADKVCSNAGAAVRDLLLEVPDA